MQIKIVFDDKMLFYFLDGDFFCLFICILCLAFGNSFNDQERCLAAGYDNGDVKLFDLRTMQVRKQKSKQFKNQMQ